jgi:DNA polymerase-1
LNSTLAVKLNYFSLVILKVLTSLPFQIFLKKLFSYEQFKAKLWTIYKKSYYMSKTTLIIDGYGFIFRAYHSLPPLSNPHGTPVGAVYGFISMLLKILAEFKPNHAVIVFDSGRKTFRHDLYDKYKMNRPEAPEDLKPQFAICREAASALNFKIIEKAGFEADDIIATLARKVNENNEKAIIVSSDKDLMQLVNDDILMYDSLKSKYITEKEVLEKFGVPPAQVRDVLAIMGDSSDNIPGIQGIGPKGAAELIQKYGSLENLLANVEEIIQPKRKQSIIDCQELAILSKKLITLEENVPLDVSLQDLEQKLPEPKVLFDFLNLHGFKSMITKAEKFFDFTHKPAQTISSNIADNIGSTILLNNIDDFKSALQDSVLTGKLSISLASHNNELAGVSFASDNKVTYFITIDNHHNGDLFSPETRTISLSFAVNILKPYFEDSSITKITYNLKDFLKQLSHSKIEINYKAFEDIMLMHYSMNTGNASSELYEILKQYFESVALTSISAILQLHKMKSIKTLQPNLLSNHFGKISSLLLNIYPLLKQDLQQHKSMFVYREIDLPLTTLLYDMEMSGVKIDVNKLAKLSATFEQEIRAREKEIFKLSGQEFNIGSPKQLGEVLFDSMGLPNPKTSAKSGSYSTGADILEGLSEAGFEIADLILKWRQLSKLKNTYTDVLPTLINPLTGRIHTTFLQTSTNTGRLSSQDPNLQNIPVRTDLGESIRETFIAEKGYKLISADYSQIELRLLSHIAGIETLKDAFKSNKDIHRETACQVFKIPSEEVTSDIRRKAKAINFGIIYGISAFGLAKQLNISRQEASLYIKEYFKEYPGIEKYMEDIKQYAKQHGYVKSLLGRKCYIKSINDKNFSLKSFSERAAINAPLQGSTADIAKIAMIKVQEALKANRFKTRMLLQVHDELLFEAPEAEVEQVMPLIKHTMQHVIELSIPLIVDIKAGNNWSEIH